MPHLFDLICRLAVEYAVPKVRAPFRRDLPWDRLDPKACSPYLINPEVWREGRQLMAAHEDRIFFEDVYGFALAGESFADLWKRTWEQGPPRGEFFCHPGYADEELRKWSSYVEGRETELAVLLGE